MVSIMPSLGSVLLAALPATLAFLAYGFFVGAKSDARKNRVALPSTIPLALNHAKLEAHRASDFPDDWWTGSELFELECRAIFSKQWLYLTHRCRFSKPGDYHTFQLARYPVFLILGKDHVIRAFHNVCRHRAYTVTKKKSGSSTVLGCRYHGWSYDTRGRLVKAPAFEDIESFDKSQNGLFEIRTHTTEQGFVYVNLSTEDVPTPDLKASDALARSCGISERSAPLAQLEFDEEINWKQAVRHMELTGFHTATNNTAHPACKAWPGLTSKMLPFLIPSSALPSAAHQAASGPSTATLSPHALTSLRVPAAAATATATATATANGPPRLWYTLTVAPASVTRTTFACSVYLNWPGDSDDEDGSAVRAIRDEVQGVLLGAAAATAAAAAAAAAEGRGCVDAGIDGGGGVQKGILDALTGHLREERRRGREVWPASRAGDGGGARAMSSGVSDGYGRAELLCRQLSCSKKIAADPSRASGLWERLGVQDELEW